MTYKLNPEIGKIRSPIKLFLPDGREMAFSSGVEAVEAVFEKQLIVESLEAVDSVVEIRVVESQGCNSINWVGEEEVSFF